MNTAVSFTTPNGEDLVVLSRKDYEALLRQAEQAAAAAEAEARNAEAAAREARRRAEMALAESRQGQAVLLNRASEVENRLAALAPQLERISAELDSCRDR